MEATTNPSSAPAGGRVDQSAAAAFLAELFDRHARTALAICRGLLRDHAEAEDAAQQTFLSAYRSLLSGAWPRDPAAWLATIARNECRTRIRERMREPLALPEAAVDESDPAAQTIRRADVQSLSRALAELPRNQQRAFMLREFGGLSYVELATALGMSAPAVESLLFRARRQLRGSLRSLLAGLSGLTSAPLALRDLVARMVEGGSAPVAVKVAAASGGAALVTVGAVPVARHHRPVAHRPVAHQPDPAARHTAVPVLRSGGGVTASVVAASTPVPASETEHHRRGRGGGVAEHRGRAVEPREPVEAEHVARVADEPRPEPEPEHNTVAPVQSADGHDGSGSGDMPEHMDEMSGDSGSGD